MRPSIFIGSRSSEASTTPALETRYLRLKFQPMSLSQPVHPAPLSALYTAAVLGPFTETLSMSRILSLYPLDLQNAAMSLVGSS